MLVVNWLRSFIDGVTSIASAAASAAACLRLEPAVVPQFNLVTGFTTAMAGVLGGAGVVLVDDAGDTIGDGDGGGVGDTKDGMEELSSSELQIWRSSTFFRKFPTKSRVWGLGGLLLVTVLVEVDEDLLGYGAYLINDDLWWVEVVLVAVEDSLGNEEVNLLG